AIAQERYGQELDHFAAKPLYSRARRIYLQNNFPIHWKRMQGAAAAFGVSLDDDHYDFSALDYLTDVPGFGCSAVYYPPATTATGVGYLSRNFDFSIDSMAEMFLGPQPPEAGKPRPSMSEPYVMRWYPTDGGYASLAIHAFDTLSGTLEGINSAGLAVTILADDEGVTALGTNWEPHLARALQVVGLHELAVMRLLLDTCATVAEAQEALLTSKQHYRFVPCHYLIADESGNSFIYEVSTGRNFQHVIDGTGAPQVITNFQIHKHSTPDSMPDPKLTLANESFWRYRELVDRIDRQHDGFTTEQMKTNNDCVNFHSVHAALSADPAEREQASAVRARTVWHSLYDQQAKAMEVSFYLGDEELPDGTRQERRSDYLTFGLD
ncbi:MAG: C45 family autoproteolytic acyltransferase/hydrolase, partial [Acidimicrobiia bacterium]|nr:C45 family autoproteolytic acyltransferase/hydrolase [Acidimicrobiia bacterium]